MRLPQGCPCPEMSCIPRLPPYSFHTPTTCEGQRLTFYFIVLGKESNSDPLSAAAGQGPL